MKDIKATRGLKRLNEWIEQGEHEMQDFKFTIPDSRKIARSLSAFANNRGGRLLIGVKDNGTIAGVRSEEDIYMVEQAAQMYCVPAQEVEFEAIKAGGNAVVIVASIEAATRRPVSVREQGDKLQAYYRVADENIVAHPLMTEAWMTDRGVMLSDDSTARELLELLADGRAIDPDSAPVMLHASAVSTRRAIVALAASDLLRFTYQDNHFVISLT